MACNCTNSILSNCSDQDLLELAGIISSLGCGPLGTNLTYMPDPTGGTMSSSTGTPAFIPLVNETNAGLVSPELYSMILNSGSLAHPAVTIGEANGLSIDVATQVLNLALASSTSTGALSFTDWNNFSNKEDEANKQNSMVYDGTGIKFPTVDAVNIQANNLARAVIATGFLDTTDAFRLSRVDDNTLGISASQFGIAFSQRFKTPPYVPSDGIVNITARNIPLSAIGLTGTGTAVKFVGYRQSDDSIIFSDTQLIQSPSVCQLGIVLVKYDAGVTSFIDANRTTVTMPDVAAYSNLDTSSTGVRAVVSIAAIPGTLSHSNTSGQLIGISVAWGTSNNDVQYIQPSSPTSFTRLHPGNKLTATPPATFTTLDPLRYWNGSALIPIAGSPNQATVQRLLFTVHGNFVWQYGEVLYTNLIAAQNNILQATFTNIIPEGTFAEVGRMAITVGCTDLASGNAQYYPTNSGGGSSGGSSGSTIWGSITGNLYDQLDLYEVIVSDDPIPVTLAPNKTFGKWVNGQTIPAGMNLRQLIIDACTEYLNPAFSSFDVSGQATTVEVGTTLSGVKVFNWSITQNSGVVSTVDIIDNTGSTILVDDTPNDGSQAVTVNTITLNSSGTTQSWKLTGNNSNGPSINSGNFVVTSLFNRYWGATPTLITDPSDGTANRLYALGLPSIAFKTNGANTFTLVTGTTYKDFVVILPPGITITSVVDTGNLNANLTQYYILSSVTLKDAGGTNRAYNQYTLRLGAQYSISTNHVITTT
jgi:hypothetical protein